MAESDALKEDILVDCRGLMCPMPIVEMAKGIARIQVGQVLRIDTDAEALRSDVPMWCRTTGHVFVEQVTTDGVTSYYVRKAAV